MESDRNSGYQPVKLLLISKLYPQYGNATQTRRVGRNTQCAQTSDSVWTDGKTEVLQVGSDQGTQFLFIGDNLSWGSVYKTLESSHAHRYLSSPTLCGEHLILTYTLCHVTLVLATTDQTMILNALIVQTEEENQLLQSGVL